MLKGLSVARQQRRRTKEMSFFRRLLFSGRVLIAKYQLFEGRFINTNIFKLPERNSKFLKIESQIRGGGSSSGNNLGLRNLGPGNATITRSQSVPSTLQWIGQEIHAHARKLFITNVLKRVSTEGVARQTAKKVFNGDFKPFFALVGVSLASGAGSALQEETDFDSLCWEIRESLSRRANKSRVGNNDNQESQQSSVSALKFGPYLKKGCSAAVYAADWSESHLDGSQDWPLAVKMMFNYDVESNASLILKAMVKETVPARHVDLTKFEGLEEGPFLNTKKCPPHPNIIEVIDVFADRVPALSESIENYPSALPQRLNPEEGLGRNMSLFLVMKRYDCSLSGYLSCHPELTFKTRVLILTQLLEGVSHLEKNGIAHRDLKTDNIVLDLSNGDEYPEVVITDFGCCLADKTHGLSIPFRSYDTDRGGNTALMAPEITTAVPGSWKWLNFEKSDVWSVGAIAYEIFGAPNPFYRNEKGDSKKLESRAYEEIDLPSLPSETNSIVQSLIFNLLKRNPSERLNGESAATVCNVYLWAPTAWLTTKKRPKNDEIMQWLVTLTTKVLCHGANELEYKIIQNFLHRIDFSMVKSSVRWIQNA